MGLTKGRPHNCTVGLRPHPNPSPVTVRSSVCSSGLISSHLDYCNSLLYGVSNSLIRKVQSVQNAAARLLTGTRRHKYISPVLRQLHWLPVQSRIDFKLACFVFSSLSGYAPPYLADHIHLVSEGPRRRLHSSIDRSCVVPRTQNTLGDRSFTVAGPRIWNSLPVHLLDEDIM